MVSNQVDLELNDTSLCPQKAGSPVIATDGDVLPCCFDIFDGYSLGKIITQGFLDICKSYKYMSISGTT